MATSCVIDGSSTDVGIGGEELLTLLQLKFVTTRRIQKLLTKGVKVAASLPMILGLNFDHMQLLRNLLDRITAFSFSHSENSDLTHPSHSRVSRSYLERYTRVYSPARGSAEMLPPSGKDRLRISSEDLKLEPLHEFSVDILSRTLQTIVKLMSPRGKGYCLNLWVMEGIEIREKIITIEHECLRRAHSLDVDVAHLRDVTIGTVQYFRELSTLCTPGQYIQMTPFDIDQPWLPSDAILKIVLDRRTHRRFNNAELATNQTLNSPPSLEAYPPFSPRPMIRPNFFPPTVEESMHVEDPEEVPQDSSQTLEDMARVAEHLLGSGTLDIDATLLPESPLIQAPNTNIPETLLMRRATSTPIREVRDANNGGGDWLFPIVSHEEEHSYKHPDLHNPIEIRSHLGTEDAVSSETPEVPHEDGGRLTAEESYSGRYNATPQGGDSSDAAEADDEAEISNPPNIPRSLLRRPSSKRPTIAPPPAHPHRVSRERRQTRRMRLRDSWRNRPKRTGIELVYVD